MHTVIVRDDQHEHTEHPVTLRDVARASRRDVTVDLTADALRERECETATVMVDGMDQLWWTDLGVRGGRTVDAAS